VNPSLFHYGPQVARDQGMAGIIQFPLLKSAEEKAEDKVAPGSKKVLNIADWTAKNPVDAGDQNVDSWPFWVA
jgi:hypothetical protein